MTILNAEKRDLAVFTIIQEEPEFIHPWLNHYRKHVAAASDLFVLVHPATHPRGTPLNLGAMAAWQNAEAMIATHHGATKLNVHRASAFDHAWLAETVARFQSFLLQSYDWVLFVEADEFVLPRPGGGARTILDVLRSLGSAPPPAVRAAGFDIVHRADEPAVAPESYCEGTNVALTAGDLLKDRAAWYSAKSYSKTLLSNVSLRWQTGFHVVKEGAEAIGASPPSGSLLLVHLHRVDFDLALGRTRRASRRNWSEADVKDGLGRHNRIDREAELRVFWDSDCDGGRLVPGRLTAIADGVRQALC